MTLLKSEDVHLFHPAEAIRVRADENKDTPWPPETPLGQNPPTGVIIDYWLKTTSKQAGYSDNPRLKRKYRAHIFKRRETGETADGVSIFPEGMDSTAERASRQLQVRIVSFGI